MDVRHGAKTRPATLNKRSQAALAGKAVLSSRKTFLIIGCNFSSATDDMLLLKYPDKMLSEVTPVFLSFRKEKKSSSTSVLAESSLAAVALSLSFVSATCCCILLNKNASPIRFCSSSVIDETINLS